MLDQSTIYQIPRHVERLLKSLGTNQTKFRVLKLLIIECGLECGFIGGCCFNGDGVENAYNVSWTSFIDRRLLENFTFLKPQDEDEEEILKFKFALAPLNEISLHCLESGNLIILTAVHSSLTGESVHSTRSLALPVNRYIVSKKLNFSNLPANFRNLRELSTKVKNALFLPLRNDIYSESACKSPYPSLHGLSFDCLSLIFRYLERKDVVSLSASCKNIREIAVPYLLRNKSKKD